MCCPRLLNIKHSKNFLIFQFQNYKKSYSSLKNIKNIVFWNNNNFFRISDIEKKDDISQTKFSFLYGKKICSLVTVAFSVLSQNNVYYVLHLLYRDNTPGYSILLSNQKGKYLLQFVKNMLLVRIVWLKS